MELTRTAAGTQSPDSTDRKVCVSPVESIVIFSLFGDTRDQGSVTAFLHFRGPELADTRCWL